ncbi:MAG: hypothetical protein ABSH11_00755 [Verrucomicrobiota bacterium]|jgi:hypothetical protein
MNPIFSVGQKVICINDAFPARIADWCDSLPVAGHIYTIRAMQIGWNRITGFSNLGFLLTEIVNPTSSDGKEAGFLQERFVPWLEACSETEHNDAVEPLQLQEAQ